MEPFDKKWSFLPRRKQESENKQKMTRKERGQTYFKSIENDIFKSNNIIYFHLSLIFKIKSYKTVKVGIAAHEDKPKKYPENINGSKWGKIFYYPLETIK